jgi:hypothetical protein
LPPPFKDPGPDDPIFSLGPSLVFRNDLSPESTPTSEDDELEFVSPPEEEDG